MNDPTTPCAISWCDGTHTEKPNHLIHRPDVGTVPIPGGPLAVALLFIESTSGGRDAGPVVTLRWTELEGDGTAPGPTAAGLDLEPDAARALGELLATAHARLAPREDSSGRAGVDVGPFETVCQAAATVREVYAQGIDWPGTFGQSNRDQLLAACEAGGVELGAWDRRIIEWLAGWEPEVVAVVVGLIARAHAAGCAR
ncbi:hypothetical protein [Actinomadura litoris]|uniref:Uncharacterized protein n=1 Tax=Actinomadura litoris TaxID=2678616 RepID=A0A7K1L3L4_9ACTN|nr:hypothetical protein [Actinomadura litoris]MUN38999.1 hypothetical protein [Actinomadura litoris]